MRLPVTAGQTWTLALGATLAVTLLATSLPPVLRQRDHHTPLTRQSPVLALAAVPAAPVPPVVIVPETSAGPGFSFPLPTGLAPPLVELPPSVPPGLPSPSPSRPPSVSPAPVATAAGRTPLTAFSAGFSSTDPDAVATAGVPADGLPVSVRTGSVVDVSYLRLTGSTTGLVLGLSAATGASTGPDALAVKACQITSSTWQPGRPGAAVPFNPIDCTPGVVQPDGSRHFDLSAYPDRSDARGFALVADLGADSSPSTRTARLVFTLAQR